MLKNPLVNSCTILVLFFITIKFHWISGSVFQYINGNTEICMDLVFPGSLWEFQIQHLVLGW